MTTTSAKLDSARRSLESVQFQHRAIFCNVSALQGLFAEKKKALAFEMSLHPNPRIGDGNSAAHPCRLMHIGLVKEFSELKSVLDFLTSTTEWQTAEGIISPLIADVAALEIQHDLETREASRIESERLDKLNAARQAAIDQVEAQFAVAVIPTPETQEPEPLFRGRVRKPELV